MVATRCFVRYTRATEISKVLATSLTYQPLVTCMSKTWDCRSSIRSWTRSIALESRFESHRPDHFPLRISLLPPRFLTES